MVIQHNMLSMNSNRQLGITNKEAGKNMEKLSSGYRINRAADDAAGLSISEKMRSQVRGLKRASMNCSDGISLINTADGAMGQTHEILQRMRVLCVQAATDIYSSDDREKIQMEIDCLVEEVDRISYETEFNKKAVFQETYKAVSNVINPDGSVTPISQPLDTGISAADIPKTGLAIVLGEDHITTTGQMTESLNLGPSWTTTGNTPEYTLEAKDADGNSLSSTLLPASYLVENNKGGVATSFGKDTVNIGGIDYEIQYQYGISGPDQVPTSLIYSIYNKNTGETVESNCVNRMENYGDEDYAGYVGYTYNCAASVDFSELGSKYQAKDLVGLGFNSGCNWCNNKRFNVAFVENENFPATTNGVGYKTERSGGINTLYIDVSTVTSGAQLTNAIVAAAQASSLNWHYTQFAYDSADPAKMYIYDNEFSRVRGPSRAIFEPIVRNESNMPQLKQPITVTSANSQTEYYLGDWYFQVGANSKQGIYSEKPILSAAVLGVNGIALSDVQVSSECIGTVDQALQMLSSEQSRMGALHNRLEYATRVDDNTAENTQAAESRLRDVDMADEFTEYSKNSILQQAAQAMLAQTNTATQEIISLLQ